MDKAIKFCVWDVGKTIYPYTLEPLNQWARQHTINPQNYNKEHNIFTYDYKPYMRGEMSFEQFYADICREYNIQTKYASQEINKALHAGVGQAYAETLSAMQMLKQKGIENCILSNALPILEDTSPVRHLVKDENNFTSFELGLLKPDPNIFIAIRDKLECDFEQIIFIDDKVENVDAAKHLGIHGIVCNHPTLLKEINNILTQENRKNFPLINRCQKPTTSGRKA